MANRLGRYRALYAAMQRPDNATTIPRHVFVRSANSAATPNAHSKGDRYVLTLQNFLNHLLICLESIASKALSFISPRDSVAKKFSLLEVVTCQQCLHKEHKNSFKK